MTDASAGHQQSRHRSQATSLPQIMRLVMRSGVVIDQDVEANSVKIVKAPDGHYLMRVTWAVAPSAASTLVHVDFSEVAAVQMLKPRE